MTKIVLQYSTFIQEYFIPRFSYNYKRRSIQWNNLWFGLALYPGDKKILKILQIFIIQNDNYSFQTKSIYGDCNKDETLIFQKKSIYITAEIMKLTSYDFWTSDKEFIWRMICVWDKDEV